MFLCLGHTEHLGWQSGKQDCLQELQRLLCAVGQGYLKVYNATAHTTTLNYMYSTASRQNGAVLFFDPKAPSSGVGIAHIEPTGFFDDVRELTSSDLSFHCAHPFHFLVF